LINSLSGSKLLRMLLEYNPAQYFMDQKKCSDCDRWIYDWDTLEVFVSHITEIHHYLRRLDNYNYEYNGELAQLQINIWNKAHDIPVCRGYRYETVNRKTKYRNSYERKRKCTRK